MALDCCVCQSTDTYSALNETSTYDQSAASAVSQTGFLNTRTSRIALLAILVCELFSLTSFSIVSLWIPVTLQLNALSYTNGSNNTSDFVNRVQLISVLALVLLCSTGLIAGIAMDTWFKKTKFVLASLILECIGFGFLGAIIIDMSYGSSCKIDGFALYQQKNPEDCYSLNILIGLVYAVSVLGSVSRTALPALGGDQIAERHGVKVFYAQFYWCQKAGEVISALICVSYLVTWNKPETTNNNHFFLFKVWAISIFVACAISLLSLTIVVCGKLTREINPDFGVLRDSLFMFVEAFKRRKEKQDDDQWLDTAKQSRGGSSADQAVEERRQMAKFSLVLFLLTPVAFATTILPLPITPNGATGNFSQNESFNQSLTTVEINLARYVTVCVAIPVIHIACNALVRRGRSITFLHRFVLGHIFMVLALVVDMIVQSITTGSSCASPSPYSVLCQIPQMILLGLCNAFIYTTGYELTLMSAPRAMQCTAMGLFYLVDGVASILCWSVTKCLMSADDTQSFFLQRTLLTGIGVALTCLSLMVLIVVEKKLRLGLDRV